MILVDTSVWVDHLRNGHDGLSELLLQDEVACHPMVIGELACGILDTATADLYPLSLLAALPIW